MRNTTVKNTKIKKRIIFAFIALLQAMCFAMLPSVASATVYTVNSTAATNTGSGTSGTLSYCVAQVNAGAGGDAIHFGVTGTISISSTLTLSKSVTIDGTSAPGYLSAPVVQVSNGGGVTNGFGVSVSGCLIKGLSVTGFTNAGIRLTASADTVCLCYLGVTLAGTASGNGYGIYVSGSNNVIGGIGTGNVVSGNSASGVEVYTGTANIIRGNTVGMNPAGTTAIPNNAGILIEAGADGNTIGGSSVGMGNYVSGNTAQGIFVNSNSNTIQGNTVGMNAAGTAAVANGDGIIVYGATNNVGGTATGASNYASGNTSAGIAASGTGNIIQGNIVGMNKAGTAAIPNNIGIVLAGTANIAGGTAAGAGNYSSGNTNYGIYFLGSGDTAQGNIVGLNVAGAIVPNNTHGIRLDPGANNNIIGGSAAGAGNVVCGTPGYGVYIASTGNIIQGNIIGLDPSGSTAKPNNNGIEIFASSNTIGGMAAGAGNVISGNSGDGISVIGINNVIQGNTIGMNAAGTAAIPNVTGIATAIGNGSNIIGGTTAGARNYISGNLGNGITLGSDDNTIQGNIIGMNAAGAAAIPNGTGIVLNGGSDTIGGVVAGAGNYISGNTGNGISVNSAGNVIKGNTVGMNVGTTAGVPNATGIVIGAAANTIGGTVSGAGNIIAGNAAGGVVITTGSSNQVSGNSIYSNGSIGIDLNNDGVTLNDPLDADTGPNGLLNFPVITSVVQGGGNTTVSGTYDGATSAAFTIELFDNAVSDKSGYGQGKTYIGSTIVTTDGSGHGTFSTAISGSYSLISATATDASNNTSEFSRTGPSFVNASPQSFTVCENGSMGIASLLHLSDVQLNQTLTWSQSAAPAHGALAFTGATAASGSQDITPGGSVTYTPASGYFGPDAFTIQATDGTATVTTTVNVTVNALPIMSAGQNTAIYTGGSATLTASGADAYSWSPTANLSATTGTSVVATPTANIVYTVTGTTNSCSATAEVDVDVKGTPTLSGSTPCAGSVLTVASDAQPIQIVWQRSGISTATITPTWAANAATVAGGNGNGSAANQLAYPGGVFVDGSGNVYIADQSNSRVQRWAPGETSGVTVAGGNGQGSAANQLAYPGGVFVDGSGNVYTADGDNNRIQKWAPGAASGITVAGGNGAGSANNQVNGADGVYVDGSGNIYTTDAHNNRIQKWAPGATSGITVAGGNGQGSAANQFNTPYGVYVDGSGNIYTADANNNRIQKWAPGATSGVTVAGGNGQGGAANQLNIPEGVYVDGIGNVFVADVGNDRIQKWAPGATSGITVAGGNGDGSAANQFVQPVSVYMDGGNNIYVADLYNARIQEFAASITTTLTATTAGNYTAEVTTEAGTITTNTVTIDTIPVSISSNAQMCAAGGGITLGDVASPDGTWSSNNTAVAIVNATNGSVTPIAQGTAIITYATGCGAAATITTTVNATPASISGNTMPLCANGSAMTLSNASTNGTWSSSNPAVASVNQFTGVVHSAMSSTIGGTAVITYTNGCAPAATTTVTVQGLPVVRTFTGGGGYCVGASGVHIGLTLSDTGISYQLYNGATAEGAAVTGSGAAIDFGVFSDTGAYHAIATNMHTSCTNYFTGVTVHLHQLPNVFNTTGGGSYCANSTGMNVGLNGSALGINYELYNGTSPVSALAGTGSALGFGPQVAAGPYSVVATNAVTGCSQIMNDTVVVTPIPLPADYAMTGGGGYCIGDTGVHVGLVNSDAGAAYQLYYNGSATGSAITSTGGTLDFGLQANGGNYSVIATNPLTTCVVAMTATVTVTPNPLPTVYDVTVVNGGNYCSADTGVHIGLSNSDLGIRYQLFKGAAGIGSPVNGIGSAIDFGLFNVADTYRVVATDTLTHCMNTMNDSAVVTITTTVHPSVAISTGIGTGDTVCTGALITFTGQTRYGGTTPGYIWVVNGANVSSGSLDSTYTYVPAAGDMISMVMSSSAACAVPPTVYDTMTIHTQDPLLPSVFIVVHPLTVITPGAPDTLIAVPTNCGSSPQFQWYKNGNTIAGATNAVYISGSFAGGDSLSCQVITSGPCGGVMTYNSVIISVRAAGVVQISGNNSDIRLIPNPNKGTFTVKGVLSSAMDESVDIEITDMLGQEFYKSKGNAHSGVLDERIQLPNTLANGMYILNLQSQSDHKVFHFVIEQ